METTITPYEAFDGLVELLLNINKEYSDEYETEMNLVYDALEKLPGLEYKSKAAERLESEKDYYKRKLKEKNEMLVKIGLTREQLEQMPMDDLKEYADEKFKPYFVREGEGETKASQLVIATCKLVYKYYNDGDRYDRKSVNPMGTYANRIRKHCFKLIGGNDYKLKLRHILINAILTVENYKDSKKVGSVYSY